MAFVFRKPPKLIAKHDAYPYQLDAVRAVNTLTYAAIFHEQGLGKTKIAIDLMLFWLVEDLVETVFVVTKKSLVQNWIEELSAHSYISPRVLSGNRRENSVALNSPVMIYVLNYEVVSANLDLISDFLNTCRVGVVLDESHKIKNPEAKLSKDFHSLAKKFARRIIMTGTPVANRPYDIWSQIKFLDDGRSLGVSFTDFKDALDLPTNGTSIRDYSRRLDNVISQIKHFSVRETKKTAGIVLPDKTILTHFVQMESHQATIYAEYRDLMVHELRKPDGHVLDTADDILKRLLRLVQCASNPRLLDENYRGLPGKYHLLVELLDEIHIKQNKVLIWTGFVENVEWLCKKLGQFSPQKVHGNMSISDRNESIRKFKTDENCRILLATPGVAKEGLTLTVANHAIFYDRSFSLDDYIQAQDRIHRISQSEDCYVHNLIARETIDEWVDTLLNAKHQAAQLTQGDISLEEFDVDYMLNLSNALSVTVSPSNNPKAPKELKR